MRRPRAIPVMTLDHEAMVKTMRFGDPLYLGDPRNALRIFNTKEVDELVILDITASTQHRGPDLPFIRELAGECFMPVAFGGGLRVVEDIEAVLREGVEKVVVGAALLERPGLADEASAAVGSQSLVAAMDVARGRRGRLRLRRSTDGELLRIDPVAWARELVDRGVGEILLTSVERDGTAAGYDLDLISTVAAQVPVPVVACGGAATVADLSAALAAGAAGAAAGRMFVTHGRHRASLVSYPTADEVEAL